MNTDTAPAPMTGQLCTCHRDAPKVIAGTRYCAICQLRKP